MAATRYVTVRLTVTEAEAILTMAASGDYQIEEEGEPGIRLPSNRAERKIRAALFKVTPPAATVTPREE